MTLREQGDRLGDDVTAYMLECRKLRDALKHEPTVGSQSNALRLAIVVAACDRLVCAIEDMEKAPMIQNALDWEQAA